MIIKNLTKLPTWRAFNDELGSTHALTTDTENQVTINFKQVAKDGDLYPWSCLTLDLSTEANRPYNIFECQEVTITYKSISEYAPILYLKEKDIFDASLMYSFELPKAPEWNTISIPLKELHKPRTEPQRPLDLSEVTGFSFAYPFPETGGEGELSISKFHLDSYEIHALRKYEDKLLYHHMEKSSPLTSIKYVFNQALYQFRAFFDFQDGYFNYIKVFGTPKQRAKVWDYEFKKGNWDYLATGSTSPSIKVLHEYVEHKRVMDLACGQGKLCIDLQECNYDEYIGVDISSEAIAQARELNRGSYNCSFHVSDISEFEPERKVDIIILSEVVYYFTYKDLKKMLEKLLTHLTDEGVLYIQIFNKVLYKKLISQLKGDFTLFKEIDCSEVTESQVDDKILFLFFKK